MKITPARARWLSLLGAWFLRGIGLTWRVHRQGVSPPHWRAIGAFLHGDILMIAHVFRGFGAAVMVSQHGDGELIARVTRRMGNEPVRGSSSRGGARAFLEMLKDWPDRPWAITPDGPRGPRGTVHEGVIQLGAESQRDIYPIAFAFSRGRRLRSWDRFAIPGLFARIVVHCGEPLRVPPEVDKPARAALASELAARIAAAEQAAENSLRDGLAPAVQWPPRPRA